MTETEKNIALHHNLVQPWPCSQANRRTLEQYASRHRHSVIGYPGAFRKLALSGDGNILVAATKQVMCVFNTKTRERLDRFVIQCDIEHIAITGDGEIVFVADAANTIHVIDLPFSHRSEVTTHRTDIASMSVDNMGARLAIADTFGRISILDTADFTEPSVMDCGFVPSRMAIRYDEDLLIVFARRLVFVYRLSTLERLARYGNDYEASESFSLTDKYLVTDTSGGLVVFDSDSGECRFVPTPSYRAYDTSADGSIFVTASNYGIRVWDSFRGSESKNIPTYVRDAQDIQICNEGQSIYVCGDGTTIDNYSVKGERVATLGDFYRPIMAAATTHDDHTLVVADEAGSVAVYDLVTGEARRFYLHTCCISKMHVEGSLVATGAHDGWARVLNLDSGEEIFGVSFPDAPVQAVSLDGDRFLATGNYLGQVHLYDLDSHELVREFHGNNCTIRSLSISPCRRYLMSTNDGGEALVFDYESGGLINQFQGFGILYSGCFDETGEFLYFGDGIGSIAKSRPESKRISRRWSVHRTDVRSVRIQGNKLVSTGIIDDAVILDPRNGKKILQCPVDTKPYHRVAFLNASGTRLVTGGQDGCLMFRHAADGKILAELHNLAHGFLWLTRDDEEAGEYGNCFWTDQEEMIQVYNRVAGVETLLAPSSEEYKQYLRIHNNRAATMARVGMTLAAKNKDMEDQVAARRNSVMNRDPVALLESIPD